MRRAPSILLALLPLLAPFSSLASTAPVTPAFQLKWGSFGTLPGQLDLVGGIAATASGDVYVVDTWHNRIQKFDRLGNLILMWGSAGSAAGQFNMPYGIGVDASGQVYVGDTSNNRIQKFSSTGTWLASWGTMGTGAGQFDSPVGVVIDKSGYVYVADKNNSRIQKFTSSGTFVAQWGTLGSANGQFDHPQGVALDPVGNLLVADYQNHRIQKFSNTGTFILKWGSNGTAPGQFQYPPQVATDVLGNVYVADQNNHRIQKFASDGTYLTQLGIGAIGGNNGEFNYPFGVAVDAAANVYVADTYNFRVQKFSATGAVIADGPGAFQLSATDGLASSGPAGVACDASGNFYEVNPVKDVVYRFTPAGAVLNAWGNVGGSDGQFNGPFGVAVDASGFVYVADTFNNRVQKFGSTGAFQSKFGTSGAGNGQFNHPSGIAIGNNSIYVADTENHRIQKFDMSGTYQSQWGGSGTGNGQFNGPVGMTIDAAGFVYVCDSGNNRVQKFTSTGAYVAQWGSSGSGAGQFSNPWGIAVDRAGNLFVADEFNSRIEKFTSNGLSLTQWGANGTGNGQFNVVLGVAVDPAGSVLVGDNGNDRVQKFAMPATILSVTDVGNDQGRQARVRVSRASADLAGSLTPIVRYDVFRRIDFLTAPSARVTTPAGINLAGWDQVGSFSAYAESEYDVVVPTLANGTSASMEYTAFMVRAATSTPATFFDSATEIGFSIDNLSPAAPSPFTAAYSAGATHLHWGVSSASDFATFRLYRGASTGFVPGPGNLVSATTDTGYADPGASGSYYKLSAVDFDGNEGPFALVTPATTTDVPPAAELAFALDGARPSPAVQGRLSVQFTLPNATPATLELLDVTGRRVREVAVGVLGPGRHVVDLAGNSPARPGLYFIRLTQGDRRQVGRVIALE